MVKFPIELHVSDQIQHARLGRLAHDVTADRLVCPRCGGYIVHGVCPRCDKRPDQPQTDSGFTYEV